MHIGGGENEGKQWDRNPQIQAFMKAKGIKDNHALQAYFNPKRPKNPAEARQENDWLGRDSASGSSQGCSHSVVARPGVAGGRREEGYNGILSAGFTTSI